MRDNLKKTAIPCRNLTPSTPKTESEVTVKLEPEMVIVDCHIPDETETMVDNIKTEDTSSAPVADAVTSETRTPNKKILKMSE